jgi:hypothetical protein
MNVIAAKPFTPLAQMTVRHARDAAAKSPTNAFVHNQELSMIMIQKC